MAREIPADRLHAGALAEVRRAATAGEVVAVACSGGADSVALVCTLWAHVPEARGRWLILHFDHRLRGRASAGDARFVAALARGLGERCAIGRWQRRQAGERGARAPRKDHEASEADARDARFAFFATAMRAAGARVLALGHNAGDVVETMLLRLTRGSGTDGLAAPRPVHRRADGSVRVRPLLALAPEAIRSAVRDARVPWREDASNATGAFARNRVRRRVVPALAAAFKGRDLAAGFLEARQALEDDAAALADWLREVTAGAAASEVGALRGRPRALARRAVHAWLLVAGVSAHLSRAAAESLIAAVVAGRETRQSAGAGSFVVLARGRLAVETAGAEDGIRWVDGTVLPVGGGAANAAGDRLHARRVRLTPALRREILAGGHSPRSTVFLATAETAFSVRRRRSGDRYRPLGAPGRARLQDLLINRKIPRDWRDRLPVVCDRQNAPVWVPGLPPAAELAVQQGTKLVVQLTYQTAGAIVP